MSYTLAPPQYYIIEDRPIDKQPLRRLQTEGADVIPTNELLQIALGTVDGFQPILQEYGIQFLTTLQSVSDIVDILKIDHLQATRLYAILSLGKRLYSTPQETLIVIRGAEDVFHNYRFMATLPKEQLRVLLVNSRYRVIHDEIIAVGNLDTLQITPVDVFHSAAARGITNIILLHNHPTGDPTPSQTDLEFTEKLIQAGKLVGITLLDHLIIAGDSYRSCL